MLLDEIGAILSGASLASSSGAGSYVLVKSWLPDSTALQDKVVALIETGGLPPDAATEIDQPTFQVLVRGTNWLAGSTGYPDARQKAQDVKDALHARAPGIYSGRYYGGFWAMQDPFLLYYDVNMRPVIACNFRTIRSRT